MKKKCQSVHDVQGLLRKFFIISTGRIPRMIDYILDLLKVVLTIVTKVKIR